MPNFEQKLCSVGLHTRSIAGIPFTFSSIRESRVLPILRFLYSGRTSNNRIHARSVDVGRRPEIQVKDHDLPAGNLDMDKVYSEVCKHFGLV